MILTDNTFHLFSLLHANVRTTMAQTRYGMPFEYEGEPFFDAYTALESVWVKRQPQRQVSSLFSISRKTLMEWEDRFIRSGAIGLLSSLSYVEVDPRLERLVILIKSTRPHENSSYALRLAQALEIPGATLEIIRRIQRSHGYGQRMAENDISFYQGLQQILESVTHHQMQPKSFGHDPRTRTATFYDFDRDSFQHRVELFRALSRCEKRRQVRPVLHQFGLHPNRYYELKNRYGIYGVWGLVDLLHAPRSGEKISPELELRIIEERLMNPKLSSQKTIREFDLKCSRANVQKIYARWNLSRFKKPIPIRGVVSIPAPPIAEDKPYTEASARSRFPNVIQTAGLKVNRGLENLLNYLQTHTVPISNPGAILIAPFLDQLGVVEAFHTYGPPASRGSEITNPILINVLRIIAGFPSIHDMSLNSDRSVAIGAGFSDPPRKSRFYDSFSNLRFHHIQKLRNDASCRARELGIIEGKQIAIDYHCDPSDSRYPRDKSLSKSPDKKGDMVYAHRPQILWDSGTHSIINIAYCEGRSRAPSALYHFLEENLFQIIDPNAIAEIYADSEYTGEKQLVYVITRSKTTVTMCLKQNPKIKRWKEETLAGESWQPYGEKYRIASRDFTLAESGIPFRFVVKQNLENNEIRCFGSTRIELSPQKIIDSYHIRWPVETGIRDLVEKLFSESSPRNLSRKNRSSLLLCHAGSFGHRLFLIAFLRTPMEISGRVGMRFIHHSHDIVLESEL